MEETLIQDIYLGKFEKNKRKSGADALINALYQLTLEEHIPERSHIDKLLYKAGNLGHELGFSEGFKTGIRLMTDCLLS